MAGDIRHLVATMDPTIGIDQVAVALGVLGVLLGRIANDFVHGPDGAINIAQQMERELLRFGEREVLGRRVERRAEDDGIELSESLGAVTQALALDRSTRCRRFRVPPQQHPLTTKTFQVDTRAVLVRQFEVGRNGVQRQHRQSLADLDAGVDYADDDSLVRAATTDRRP